MYRRSRLRPTSKVCTKLPPPAVPTVVRARVKELMKLNENRGVKKDARDFKRWLADYMRRYGEFEPLKAAAVPATVKSDKLPAATKTPKACGCLERRQGPEVEHHAREACVFQVPEYRVQYVQVL
ncbi:hypothetical protein DYB36_013350 [Aphanomyces astaci]|uniref:Uncharacterized protein n=1 Tax=Aphanomyces astaci TaxID=112090 RepID=A0A397A3C7_APHAT|nr:hypothetical protein DYB36_013350 [Aphanomyces astaci]